jgi:hypothetical protein
VAEGTRLLSGRRPKAYRGFESLPLRSCSWRSSRQQPVYVDHVAFGVFEPLRHVAHEQIVFVERDDAVEREPCGLLVPGGSPDPVDRIKFGETRSSIGAFARRSAARWRPRFQPWWRMFLELRVHFDDQGLEPARQEYARIGAN